MAAAADRVTMGRAIDGRTVIGQAQGLLMGRLGISPEDDFARLVSMSQNSDVKLLHVAHALVADHRRNIQTQA